MALGDHRQEQVERERIAMEERVKQRELLLQRAALLFEQEKAALNLRANPFDTIQYLMYMGGASPTLPGRLPQFAPIPEVGGVETPPRNWGPFDFPFNFFNNLGYQGGSPSPIRHSSVFGGAGPSGVGTM